MRLWLTLSLVLLGGCSSVGYYAQTVGGHLELMARREPIATLQADPEQPAALRQRLREVEAIRDFASAELGLPDNGSYRSYVPVEGPAVVWSLVATDAFSVEPRQWCYPVIGCASYRGYYDRAAAERHAARLAALGQDTAVEAVPAYSTLGWFDDPLPQTVVDWPAGRLAGLLFHELAHQQLYVPGDSAFNEAFANAVERAGVERWLTYRGDAAALRDWQLQQQRQRAFVELLLATRARLADLYASPLPEGALAGAKAATLAGLRADYQQLRSGWGGYAGYDGWFERPLNNARLASVATYEAWAPAFTQLLRDAEHDLGRFYAACKALARLAAGDRRRQLERLAARYRGSDQSPQPQVTGALGAVAEVVGNDAVDRGGRDAELRQTVAVADAVDLH